MRSLLMTWVGHPGAVLPASVIIRPSSTAVVRAQLLVYIASIRLSNSKRTMMTELDEFRAYKDEFFKTHPQSPLTPEQQQSFQGLHYFPENPALRLIVPVEEFADQDPIVMQTSTGDVQEYTRYGRLHFTVDGQAVELTLYADGDAYFLPFADALA